MSQNVPPRQRQGLEVLLNGGTVQAAADAAGVQRRTVTRWLGDDRFKGALAEAEAEKMAGVHRKLLQLADAAAETLARSMDDDSASNQQIRSASVALSNLLKVRELVRLDEIVERLEALEARIRR